MTGVVAAEHGHAVGRIFVVWHRCEFDVLSLLLECSLHLSSLPPEVWLLWRLAIHHLWHRIPIVGAGPVDLVLRCHLLGEVRVRVVMRVKRRRDRRRGSEGRVDGTLELRDGIGLIFRSLRCGLDITAAEVDVLGRVGDLLPRPLLLDEGRDVFFNFAVLEGQSDSLARLTGSALALEKRKT